METNQFTCSFCNTKFSNKSPSFTCSSHQFKLCEPCSHQKGCPECEKLKRDPSSLQGSSLQRGRSDSNKMAEENQNLRKPLQEPKMEAPQLKFKKSGMQLEKSKTKHLYEQKIPSLEHSNQEMMQAKTAFDTRLRQFTEKDVEQYRKDAETLRKQNQELRQEINDKLEKMKKANLIQIQTLKANHKKEQQQKQLQFVQLKNKDRRDLQEQKDQMISDHKQKQAALQKEQQTYITKLKEQHQKQIQKLKQSNESQRKSAEQKYQQIQKSLKLYFKQKDSMIENHNKEINDLQAKYKDNEKKLKSQFDKKEQKFEENIKQLNEQHQKFVKDKKAQIDKLQLEIKEYKQNSESAQRKIQQLQRQREKLKQDILFQNKQIVFQKKQISQFGAFIEMSCIHLVEQFKRIGDINQDSSLQMVTMTQLMIKHYKAIVVDVEHEALKKIISERQTAITNYVGGQMIKYLQKIEGIEVKDFYSVHSEKGKIFCRVIQNLNLFKSLNVKNVNDAIEMYFSQKLYQKIKTMLQNYQKTISAKNNEKDELEFVKQVECHYELKEFLSREFPEHQSYCESEYKGVDQTIKIAFNRFNEFYLRIKEKKPILKFEDYVQKAEDLKRFVILINSIKNHRKYAYNLEFFLNSKIEQKKTVVFDALNEHKKNLKIEFDKLVQQRVYSDCFKKQKIYKKLKIFDQILTKQENHFYNFNFTQLYNKILNLLKILKEEKINLAGLMITEEKINIEDFKKYFSDICLDLSIKSIYLQKLKATMINRAATLNKVDDGTKITGKLMEQFCSYYQEATQLKNINDINQLSEVKDQQKLYKDKLTHFTSFLKSSFRENYFNSSEFRQLYQSRGNIKTSLKFQLFIKKNFQEQYSLLKKQILEENYQKLPKAESEDQCVFSILERLNIQNQQKLQQIINHNHQLTDQNFQFYTNMVAGIPKYQANLVQQKLYKFMQNSIKSLQQNQWKQGDLNSSNERELLKKLNKLQNKDIAFYRQMINISKNKVIEERQKIINSQKRRLKQDRLENLQQFITNCQKQQTRNPKLFKLYINILEEYLNYAYENTNGDNESKCKFVQTIYKLNLVNHVKSIKQIFRTKQQAIYHSRPDLFTVKDNVELIENFKGEKQINIPQLVKSLTESFKLSSILSKNQGKSLLSQEQRWKILRQIETIRYSIKKNCINLCHSIENLNLLEENCDRKMYFLVLIKIQIYLRLIKKLQQVYPNSEKFQDEQYKKIVEKNNTNIKNVYNEIKKFRFYKEELDNDCDNQENLLSYLRTVEINIGVFKDMKYNLRKYEDYLRSNYLDEFGFKDIDYLQIIKMIEMTWIKEYAVIKKQISAMFITNDLKFLHKYKVILNEKQLIKKEHFLYFNEFIKEQYDFKKNVIEELMLIDSKCQRYLHQLEKQHQLYQERLKKMEDDRKDCIQTGKQQIRLKYQKLKAKTKNSYQQIIIELQRQKMIQAQLNTLENQERGQEKRLNDKEMKKIQSFKAKSIQKMKRWVNKIVYFTAIIKNVQVSFDKQIQQICQRIISKIDEQKDKQDQGFKNLFENNELKNSSNKQSVMNDDQGSAIDDFEQRSRSNRSIADKSRIQIKGAESSERLDEESNRYVGQQYTIKVVSTSDNHKIPIRQMESQTIIQKQKVDSPQIVKYQPQLNKAQKMNASIQSVSKRSLNGHQKTTPTINNLNSLELIQEAIKQQDYQQANREVIRTIIAIDGTGSATGSMGLTLKAISGIITTTLNQMDSTIKTNNFKSTYEYGIIIFRNYNSKQYQKLIQKSKFSKDPKELEAFLASIKVEGGMGNQAHEALFYEIGKMCEVQKIDQIILIGDAAGNKYEEMVRHRKKFSGEAYWSTRIPLLPNTESYIQPIKAKGIPLHSLYILKNKPETDETDREIKAYFKTLSGESKGVCQQLFLTQIQGTKKQLNTFITKRVLKLMDKDLLQISQ